MQDRRGLPFILPHHTSPLSLVQWERPLYSSTGQRASMLRKKKHVKWMFFGIDFGDFSGVPRGLLLQAVAFKRQSGIHTPAIAQRALLQHPSAESVSQMLIDLFHVGSLPVNFNDVHPLQLTPW